MIGYKSVGRTLTANGSFGIVSSDIRFSDGKVLKGYYAGDFADAWSRYLPPETPSAPDSPVSKRNNATARINTSENAGFGSATEAPCSVSENAQIASTDAPCSGVAFQEPEIDIKGREEDL
jgi:hypothetical protein